MLIFIQNPCRVQECTAGHMGLARTLLRHILLAIKSHELNTPRLLTVP